MSYCMSYLFSRLTHWVLPSPHITHKPFPSSAAELHVILFCGCGLARQGYVCLVLFSVWYFFYLKISDIKMLITSGHNFISSIICRSSNVIMVIILYKCTCRDLANRKQYTGLSSWPGCLACATFLLLKVIVSSEISDSDEFTAWN